MKTLRILWAFAIVLGAMAVGLHYALELADDIRRGPP